MPDPPKSNDPYATAKEVRAYLSPAYALFSKYALMPWHQNEKQAEDQHEIRTMPNRAPDDRSVLTNVLVGAGVMPAPGESNADYYDQVWGARNWFPSKALEDVYVSGKPRLTADTSAMAMSKPGGDD